MEKREEQKREAQSPARESEHIASETRSGSILRGGRLSSRLGRLVLPAAVQPEVLLGRLADQSLEGGREALRDVAHGVPIIIVVLRIDDIGDLQMIAAGELRSADDHHGHAMLQGEQSDGLV